MTERELKELIKGAVYNFAGYLTTRDKTIKAGATEDASPMAKAVEDWTRVYKIYSGDTDHEWPGALKELKKQEEITNKDW